MAPLVMPTMAPFVMPTMALANVSKIAHSPRRRFGKKTNNIFAETAFATKTKSNTFATKTSIDALGYHGVMGAPVMPSFVSLGHRAATVWQTPEDITLRKAP